MEICEVENCTACKVCANVCARNAIKFDKDNLDNIHAYIDSDLCVKCNRCKKVCPQLNEAKYNQTKYCYAGWSLNEDIRNEGASGGIASEIYNEYLNNNGFFIGVQMKGNTQPILKIGNDLSSINEFKNSKYVYADSNYVYKDVGKLLKNGCHVVFIGLPCQVAAMKNYVNIANIDDECLLLVDLICHGVASYDYLKQHIGNLENKYSFKTDKCFFRDPYTFTYTYTFTLRNKEKVMYARKVHYDDVYQIGYHNGIIYRENCYSCMYAQKKRVGDITLADFASVGTLKPCNYDNKNVSCILCNTTKGKKYIEKLYEDAKIFLELRPVEEEWNYEKMLSHPTRIPKERAVFIKHYSRTKNFDHSMKISARKILIKNFCNNVLKFNAIRRQIVSYIPSPIKKYIKNRLYRVL